MHIYTDKFRGRETVRRRNETSLLCYLYMSSYSYLFVHELLLSRTVPFNVHEKIHEYFLNIIHYYSSKAGA